MEKIFEIFEKFFLNIYWLLLNIFDYFLKVFWVLFRNFLEIILKTCVPTSNKYWLRACLRAVDRFSEGEVIQCIFRKTGWIKSMVRWDCSENWQISGNLWEFSWFLVEAIKALLGLFLSGVNSSGIVDRLNFSTWSRRFSPDFSQYFIPFPIALLQLSQVLSILINISARS